ncbi:hypothetical protein chiPu_0008801 [Chiloscyllium punctatum]|uniref:Selenoprotein T n=1 Tax=Chiloscyllium punctatum TaxID=137246 RepID=A0A401SJ30_CHIPU|nr:hypothetical protein [Chiloscyllium punctatum]
MAPPGMAALSLVLFAVTCLGGLGQGLADKRLKMQYVTGPVLRFQICICQAVMINIKSLSFTWYRKVFEEYTRVISQRYPDIRIEGENYLPQPIYRHVASFLSVFKLVLIGLIIVGKDPFPSLGMETPSIWHWSQQNKIYACMMVFFLSNMIENQCMSTGAFEITLNDVPVWSKLESGHLPSMQQLVQILDNEMKLNVHMDSIPLHRS